MALATAHGGHHHATRMGGPGERSATHLIATTAATNGRAQYSVGTSSSGVAGAASTPRNMQHQYATAAGQPHVTAAYNSHPTAHAPYPASRSHTAPPPPLPPTAGPTVYGNDVEQAIAQSLPPGQFARHPPPGDQHQPYVRGPGQPRAQYVVQPGNSSNHQQQHLQPHHQSHQPQQYQYHSPRLAQQQSRARLVEYVDESGRVLIGPAPSGNMDDDDRMTMAERDRMAMHEPRGMVVGAAAQSQAGYDYDDRPAPYPQSYQQPQQRPQAQYQAYPPQAQQQRAPPPPPPDSDSDQSLFHAYLLDYLQRHNLHATAQALLREAPDTPVSALRPGQIHPASAAGKGKGRAYDLDDNLDPRTLPSPALPIDGPARGDGVLYEWWSVFWDVWQDKINAGAGDGSGGASSKSAFVEAAHIGVDVGLRGAGGPGSYAQQQQQRRPGMNGHAPPPPPPPSASPIRNGPGPAQIYRGPGPAPQQEVVLQRNSPAHSQLQQRQYQHQQQQQYAQQHGPVPMTVPAPGQRAATQPPPQQSHVLRAQEAAHAAAQQAQAMRNAQAAGSRQPASIMSRRGALSPAPLQTMPPQQGSSPAHTQQQRQYAASQQQPQQQQQQQQQQQPHQQLRRTTSAMGQHLQRPPSSQGSPFPQQESTPSSPAKRFQMSGQQSNGNGHDGISPAAAAAAASSPYQNYFSPTAQQQQQQSIDYLSPAAQAYTPNSQAQAQAQAVAASLSFAIAESQQQCAARMASSVPGSQANSQHPTPQQQQAQLNGSPGQHYQSLPGSAAPTPQHHQQHDGNMAPPGNNNGGTGRPGMSQRGGSQANTPASAPAATPQQQQPPTPTPFSASGVSPAALGGALTGVPVATPAKRGRRESKDVSAREVKKRAIASTTTQSERDRSNSDESSRSSASAKGTSHSNANGNTQMPTPIDSAPAALSATSTPMTVNGRLTVSPTTDVFDPESLMAIAMSSRKDDDDGDGDITVRAGGFDDVEVGGDGDAPSGLMMAQEDLDAMFSASGMHINGGNGPDSASTTDTCFDFDAFFNTGFGGGSQDGNTIDENLLLLDSLDTTAFDLSV